ncbi:nitroreductase family protein [Eremococcus coleocola]|uniref:Nitroreductase domain-containing protein n=1 Tax=Eremococcus coleocola ACS-139-V-Col8 TaxID=908337 RepID=E4KRF9_9LACT|nr:nitroreductase family protein [Eremococcus coleocola]EFR30494.1 hypothetical protein HMPREF9257_0460 [Eremococcus coleocola ACS-139-V-Col8]
MFIFLVDCYRNAQIMAAQEQDATKLKTMDFFNQGAVDARLAAQNMVNAIEADGLGTVFLGLILNDPQAVIDLLALPQLTFPILGLGFGYPDDQPDLKPRISLKFKVGEKAYPYHKDILPATSDYDQAMTHYYDTRDSNRRAENFSHYVVNKVS